MLRKDKGLESQRREIDTAIEREKDKYSDGDRKKDKATEREEQIQLQRENDGYSDKGRKTVQ